MLTKAIPMKRPQIRVIVNLLLDNSEKSIVHEVRVVMKSPEDKEIASKLLKTLPIPNDASELGLIFQLDDIEFQKIGIYRLEIIFDKKRLAVKPLKISLQK